MDIQKLKYFIAVVENGTVSKAAKVLNMTQPPLSMLLKKFEDEIGIQLFRREGKRLYLTDSGQLVYQRGIELLASSEAILQEAREYQQDHRGTVSIGCAAVANFSLIPEVIKRMNDRSINIVTHVKEGSPPYILDHLRFHKLDIGMVRNVYNRNDLITTKLFTEPVMVALPSGHPLAGKKSVALEELQDENFLLHHSSYEYNISDTIIMECKKRGISPNIVYWGTETLPMLGMVKAGMGIAFPPKSVIKSVGVELPPLVELCSPAITTTLNLVTMKNSVQKDAVIMFLNILQEVIEEMTQEFGIPSMNETNSP
ncbi:LysR family transcriptional regulator [Bacillus norwichensis]|uniref:LysR family transcriptional regulator n=1 Tax=Bacillus norwichensis TaxID=2762217 RepID=A0ABR8VHN2_9BACI|nr:LysR family transcriptional regulator [Bacillus norwichensis]MBD8004106.1 LysR family transcriptional regulator [Bacillus norwichensis]